MGFKYCAALLFILVQVLIHNGKYDPVAKNLRRGKSPKNKVYYDSAHKICSPLRKNINVPKKLVYESRFTCETQNGLNRRHKSVGNFGITNRRRNTKSQRASWGHLPKKPPIRKIVRKEHTSKKKKIKINKPRGGIRSKKNKSRRGNKDKRKSVPKSKGRKNTNKVPAAKKGPKNQNKTIWKRNEINKKQRKVTKVPKNGTRKAPKLNKGLSKTNSPLIKGNTKRNVKKNLSSNHKEIQGNNHETYIVNKKGKCVKIINKNKKSIIRPKARAKRTKVQKRIRRPRRKRMAKHYERTNRRKPGRRVPHNYNPKSGRMNRNSGKGRMSRYLPPHANRKLPKSNLRSSRRKVLSRRKTGTYPKVRKNGRQQKWPSEKFSSEASCKLHLLEYQQDAPVPDSNTATEAATPTDQGTTNPDSSTMTTVAATTATKLIQLDCKDECLGLEKQCQIYVGFCWSCISYPEDEANRILSRVFDNEITCTFKDVVILDRCQPAEPGKRGYCGVYSCRCTKEGAINVYNTYKGKEAPAIPRPQINKQEIDATSAPKEIIEKASLTEQAVTDPPGTSDAAIVQTMETPQSSKEELHVETEDPIPASTKELAIETTELPIQPEVTTQQTEPTPKINSEIVVPSTTTNAEPSLELLTETIPMEAPVETTTTSEPETIAEPTEKPLESELKTTEAIEQPETTEHEAIETEATIVAASSPPKSVEQPSKHEPETYPPPKPTGKSAKSEPETYPPTKPPEPSPITKPKPSPRQKLIEQPSLPEVKTTDGSVLVITYLPPKPRTKTIPSTTIPTSPPTKITQASTMITTKSTPKPPIETSHPWPKPPMPHVVLPQPVTSKPNLPERLIVQPVQPQPMTTTKNTPSVIIHEDRTELSTHRPQKPITTKKTRAPKRTTPSRRTPTAKTPPSRRRKRPVDECWIEQGPYAGKCVNVKKFLDKYGALPSQYAMQDPWKIANTLNEVSHKSLNDIFGALRKGSKGKGSTMERALYFGKTATFSTSCRFIMEKLPVSNGFLYSLAEACKRRH